MLQLRCSGCGAALSERGMQVCTTLDASIVLYSSDRRPQGIVDLDSAAGTVPGQCPCQIQDFSCSSCGLRVGYSQMGTCEECANLQEDNQHRWFFNTSSVRAEMQRTPEGDFVLWPPRCETLNLTSVPPMPSPLPSLVTGRPDTTCLPSPPMQRTCLPTCLTTISGVPPLPSPSPCYFGVGQPGATLLPESFIPNQPIARGSQPGCGGESSMPTLPALTSEKREDQEALQKEDDSSSGRETWDHQQLTSWEAELFEKDLEQNARDKVLRSVTAAQQETEAELRNREEDLARREAALEARLEAAEKACVQSACAQTSALAAGTSCKDGRRCSLSEVESLRKEMESLRALLAAKNLEAQSVRVKAAADTCHLQEEVAELRNMKEVSLEKARQQREHLAHWEEHLALRAKALSAAEWRLEADKLLMDGPGKVDSSGIPTPLRKRQIKQQQYPEGPCAWGQQNIPRLPSTPCQGRAGWFPQLGCCRRARS